MRIDPARNRVSGDPIRVGDEPTANSRDGTLSRIDPGTNRLLGRSVRVAQIADRLSTGIQNPWVTSYADQTLTRLEGAD